MKRILSLLLAAALAAALLAGPAAAADAASAPWAQVDGRTVSLQGISRQYNAVQLTLKLDQEAGPGAFQLSAALSGSGVHAACTAQGDTLTLYVTSKGVLNQGSSLQLGSLTGQGLSVVGVSSLELIRMDANNAQSVAYDDVEIRSGPSGGGGGSGWGGGSGGAARYPVGTAAGSGGSVRLSAAQAAQGETVTITTTPDAGYILSSLTVTDKEGRGVTASGLGGGKWSFVMPACGVTVAVSFTQAQQPALPFADVRQGDWFQQAVAYVYGAGLMNGTDAARFSPEGTTTRGMIVTILHRYEGTPAAGPSAFHDVPAGAYYGPAVSWAAASGVVNGVEPGRFGPEEWITREQMAAILYRYAQHKGLSVDGRADLSAYADGGQVSPYAVDAMAWAVHAGLISGVDSRTLQPGGSATRAQVAAILMRFCENVAGR